MELSGITIDKMELTPCLLNSDLSLSLSRLLSITYMYTIPNTCLDYYVA